MDTKSSKSGMVLSIISGLLLLLSITIILFFINQPDRLIFNSSTTTIDRMMSLRHSKNLNAAVIFYQPGCKDCRKVASQILKSTAFNKRLKVIKINTQNDQNAQYIKKFSVTKTPTFIRYDHGKVTRYSGTNKIKVAKLMDTQ